MTGEITLTGRVLPIGGLREKSIAAQRFGVKRVIAPKQNEPDFEEFPDSLKKDIRFHWVDKIDQVLEIALEPEKGARRQAQRVSQNGRAKRRSTRVPAAAKPQ
jgi:ATP-dependent Lon protease